MEMQAINLALALLLLLNLVVGLYRVVRGPDVADRMLAAQLFGTTSVGIILLLAEAFARPALRDVALVFSLLAAVTAIAFVQRAWVETDSERGPD